MDIHIYIDIQYALVTEAPMDCNKWLVYEELAGLAG